ncbi:MAG: RluA family pseudouridine synthase [Chloroflexi bacterium]|nr:RluA family pseudouridine synthase [Chloroflexota bacterium]
MQILHQDSFILVVNKTADLSVLPEGWEKDAPYLVKMLEEKHGKIWVVHRIDKVTSGVIIFALTAEAHRALNIQFERHEVEKAYHALVNGVPKWGEKVTKFPLRVNVVERYQAAALVEASPMTGRTHQIRVHAYALGYPLLGDFLYSAPETDVIARPALHAWSLSVTHPETGKRLTFQADYPNDFQKAVGLLRGK